MQWTDRIRHVKIILVVAAVVIAVASLVVSNALVRELADEERNKMETWAEAMRALNTADENTESFKRSFLGRMLFSGDDVSWATTPKTATSTCATTTRSSSNGSPPTLTYSSGW